MPLAALLVSSGFPTVTIVTAYSLSSFGRVLEDNATAFAKIISKANASGLATNHARSIIRVVSKADFSSIANVESNSKLTVISYPSITGSNASNSSSKVKTQAKAELSTRSLSTGQGIVVTVVGKATGFSHAKGNVELLSSGLSIVKSYAAGTAAVRAVGVSNITIHAGAHLQVLGKVDKAIGFRFPELCPPFTVEISGSEVTIASITGETTTVEIDEEVTSVIITNPEETEAIIIPAEATSVEIVCEDG